MAGSTHRLPGTRPDPGQPAGTPNPEMPFEHLVVVMMENHSFDNLLGALSQHHPKVDGLTFAAGKATNSNPGTPKTAAIVQSFPVPDTSQGSDVSQSWRESHAQINGGAM